MSSTTISKCWLCGKEAALTREHIPPRRAFNDMPLLLARISERSREVGRIVWETHTQDDGVAFRSLCGGCNSRLGVKYGTEYAPFIQELARRVERAPRGSAIQIEVPYPLRILKAIAQCFFTANGEGFARKQEWMQRFLLNSRDRSWPPEIHLYVYACPVPGGRSTGLVASINIRKGGFKAISEFSFWPLGAVLSFHPLEGLPLVPIHQWATQFEYKDRGPASLTLPVNIFASAFPLDFRSRDEVIREAANP